MRYRACFTFGVIGLLVAIWCTLYRGGSPPSDPVTEWQAEVVHVSKAVDYRYFAEGSLMVGSSDSDALILDVDLASPTVRLQVAADTPVRRKGGKVFGISHAVRDWCAMHGAIAGINGGFFGESDPDGVNKQAEGLLVVEGKVYNPGRWVKSTRKAGETFLRCALGIGGDGSPQIGWATCSADGTMHVYDRPLSPAGSRSFNVSSAVACGPRLVAAGREEISDDKERLVSSLPLPRTFVAYDYSSGKHTDERKPRHFVMGVAMQMTYHDVAKFLLNYFRKQHGAECAEAMCLDGGSSSQLVYRTPGHKNGSPSRPGAAADDWVDARPSHVTVPTALLVVSGKD